MSVTRREQLQREDCDDMVDGDALGLLSNDVTRCGQLQLADCDDIFDGDGLACLSTDVTRWELQLQCGECDDTVDGDASGCCPAMLDGDVLGPSACWSTWLLVVVGR